jgi:hypothetical protein
MAGLIPPSYRGELRGNKMTRKISYPNDLEIPLIDRRKFLVTSGLGIAGLTLSPLSSAYASPVFWAVARFAGAVGAGVIANLITDYIRGQYLSGPTVEEVVRINNRMAQDSGRFSDLSQSTVYCPERAYFFYPARSLDKFNCCVAFFDGKRGYNSQNTALIEGPTVFGISEAATAVAQRRSTTVSRDVFLPRTSIQNGTGNFEKGYTQPDIYETRAGTVEANYGSNGNGTGTVTVVAKNERGTIFEGDYTLNYRA